MESHNTLSSDSRSSDSKSSVSTSSSSSINDSESSNFTISLSTISLPTLSIVSSSHVTCFFDGTTQINQKFSIPEKILYYMAKNPKNAAVFQKLIETCKYFFIQNPIIVAPQLVCIKKEWYACSKYEFKGRKCQRGFKINNLPSNYKIWLSDKIVIRAGDDSILQIMPRIYQSDAIDITFENDDHILTFKEFLFLASNAERMVLDNRSIKYENGDTVPFETIIKSLPKLKWLNYESDNGKDITSNSAMNLIEDFKRFSYLNLNGLNEKFNVKTIYDFIIKNRHVVLDLCYRRDISETYKERINKYSDRLEYYNRNKCRSTITFSGMRYVYINSSDNEDMNVTSSNSSSNEILNDGLFSDNDE
uniref:Uncharacterized protein n=1 Tax=Panagrolaimus sp. ES5 TaxID=591445 RepID=A0AC34FF28_9BILA